MEPRLKWNKNNFSMNIHEAVSQPIGAFAYCNRQAAAGRRRQRDFFDALTGAHH